MSKQFEATWGDGYDPGQEIVQAEFFSGHNGYEPEDIEAIEKLEVGEFWVAPTVEQHTVRRIA